MSKTVLFLVALATAKRVSVLQALSLVVSSSGRDLICLLYRFLLLIWSLLLTLFLGLIGFYSWVGGRFSVMSYLSIEFLPVLDFGSSL